MKLWLAAAAAVLPVCWLGCLAGLETGSTGGAPEPPPVIHTSAPATAAPPPATAAPAPATAAPAPATAAPAPATAAPPPATAAPLIAPVTAAPPPATAAPAPPPSLYAATVVCTAAGISLDGRVIAPVAYGSIQGDYVALDPDLAATVVPSLRDALAARRASLVPPTRAVVAFVADPDVPYGVVAPAALAVRASKLDVHYALGGKPPAYASDAAPTKVWDRPISPTSITDTRVFTLALVVRATGTVEFVASKPLPYGFAGRPGSRVEPVPGGRVDVGRVVSALEAIKSVYPGESSIALAAEDGVPWRLVFPLVSAVRLTADGAPLFPIVRLEPAK